MSLLELTFEAFMNTFNATGNGGPKQLERALDALTRYGVTILEKHVVPIKGIFSVRGCYVDMHTLHVAVTSAGFTIAQFDDA